MPEDFSTRLRFARQLRGLSQASLGKESELEAYRPFSHFETGLRSPSFENLKRLANALNISSDYLIGRNGGTGAVLRPGGADTPARGKTIQG